MRREEIDLFLHSEFVFRILGVGEDLGGGSDTEEDRNRTRQKFQALSSENEADLQAMAERFKQSSKIIEDLEEYPIDPSDALAIRHSLIPTTADPAMWCVRCQVREFVSDLLNCRFLALKPRDSGPFPLSTDSLGYLKSKI